jgi:hypothetical protein
MSSNVVLVSDSRLELLQDGVDRQVVSVPKSGIQNTQYNQAFQSFSTSSCTASIDVSGLKFCLSSDIRVNFTVQFTITDPNINAQFEPLYDCIRAFPINNSLQNLAVTINNSQIQQANYQFANILAEYNNSKHERDGELSLTPTQQDPFQRPQDQFTLGFIESPFSLFGVNKSARAGFPYTESLDKRTRTYFFSEPLLMSPFTTDPSAPFLSNINKLSLNLTFQPNLFNYMFQHIAGGAHDYLPSSVIVSFPQVPQVAYSIITPTERIMRQIPDTLRYGWTQYQNSFQQITLGGGATQTIYGQTYKLSSIPSRVYICLCSNWDTLTSAQNRRFAKINSVSIQYNSGAPLLSNCSPQDLYQMSRKNGYTRSFVESSSYIGGVLAIDFTRDIMQPEDLAAGTSQSTNVTIQINATNLDSAAADMMYVNLFQFDGVVQVSGNYVLPSVGVLSVADVAAAVQSPTSLTESEYEHLAAAKPSMAGGAHKRMSSRRRMGGSMIGGGLVPARDIQGGGMAGGELVPAREVHFLEKFKRRP